MSCCSLLPQHTYLLMPSNAMLTISTAPPVGLVNNPRSPLPMPLKKPSVPSSLTPETCNNLALLAHERVNFTNANKSNKLMHTNCGHIRQVGHQVEWRNRGTTLFKKIEKVL